MMIKNLILLVSLAVASNAVQVIVDSSRARDLDGYGRKGAKLIEREYDHLSRYLSSPNYQPPATVYIVIDPEYNGVAEAGGDRIRISAKYIRDTKQRDFGVFIHEVTHLIQGYRRGCDGWVTEGIADFTRRFLYTKIPFVDEHQKMLPREDQRKWRVGYGEAAYFLNWVHQNYRTDMVYWMNRDCREGNYNDGIFKKLIGKDINTLWDEMQSQFDYLN